MNLGLIYKRQKGLPHTHRLESQGWLRSHFLPTGSTGRPPLPHTGMLRPQGGVSDCGQHRQKEWRELSWCIPQIRSAREAEEAELLFLNAEITQTCNRHGTTPKHRV